MATPTSLQRREKVKGHIVDEGAHIVNDLVKFFHGISKQRVISVVGESLHT